MADIPHPTDAAAPEVVPEVAQVPLPLDLDPDEPVPFRLTPKARRAVAPSSLPDLHLVPVARRGPDDPVEHAQPVDLDDPSDPRSARARAMRRGGLSSGQIAARLDVDELVVRAWTQDVRGAGRRRGRLRAVPAAHPGAGRAAGSSDPATGDVTRDEPADEQLRVHRLAFDRARSDAAASATDRLADPAFVRGLALVAAGADIDPHAVVVTVRDLDVARVVRAWLADHAGADPASLRVVLRLGSTSGADLVVHQWSEVLQVPLERMARTRWSAAPAPAAVEALVRVADGTVAARVAGWRDALLGDTTGQRADEPGF